MPIMRLQEDLNKNTLIPLLISYIALPKCAMHNFVYLHVSQPGHEPPAPNKLSNVTNEVKHAPESKIIAVNHIGEYFLTNALINNMYIPSVKHCKKIAPSPT